MNLSQLANLGEFIGGLAVLVTLVYLALQVRSSAQSERAETHRAFIENWNRSFFGPTQNPATARLMRRAATDFGALDGDEQMAAASILGSTLLLCQETHYLYQEGSIDEEFATTIDTFIASMLQLPGFATWWEEGGRVFRPTYRDHVAKLVASPNPPPPLTEMWAWFAERPEHRTERT